jgi:hypothetical protein
MRVPFVIPDGKFAGAYIVEMESADLVHLAVRGLCHRPELVEAITRELRQRRKRRLSGETLRRLICRR